MCRYVLKRSALIIKAHPVLGPQQLAVMLGKRCLRATLRAG
jgi:hypothetical protein